MTGYFARHQAAVLGLPLPPGGSTQADRVLAQRQPQEPYMKPLITMTFQAEEPAALFQQLTAAATLLGAALTGQVVVAADTAPALIAQTEAEDRAARVAREKATTEAIGADARAAAEAATKAQAEAKAAADAKTPAETAKADTPAEAVVYDQVRDAVQALMLAKGRDAVVATLGKLGVATAKELPEARWAEALGVLKASAA